MKFDPKFYDTSKLKNLKRHKQKLIADGVSTANEEKLLEDIKIINAELRQRSKRRWNLMPAHLKGVQIK